MIAQQTQLAEHLLRALLAPSPPSIPALADELELSLLELLEHLEAIKPQLDSLSAITTQQSAIHAARARRAAIDTLTEIAADPDTDPIERRRAATAVLRAAGARTSSPANPDRATGGSPTSATRPLITSIPTAPEPLATQTLRALARNDDPAPDTGLATLHAACAPGATINDEPVADDLDDFLDDLEDDTRHALTDFFQHIIDPPTQTEDAYHQRITLYQKGRCHTAHLQLRRQPPPPAAQGQTKAPWRIEALTIKPIESGFK